MVAPGSPGPDSPGRGGGLSAALQQHPVGLVLVAVLSVQFGGALAATLLPLVGVAGSVLLRMLLAAVIMLAVIRPRWSGRSRQDWATVVLFAGALTAMNLCFYASLQRLPIGVAVTIEFLGPLLLAAATSRQVRDLLATDAGIDAANVQILPLNGAPKSLLELSQESLDAIRRPILEPLGRSLEAPCRVALYLFSDGSWVIENFNDRPVTAKLDGQALELEPRGWICRWK